MSDMASATAKAAFERHERTLWGLAYRMLGVPADADDVVQDVFARFLTAPPPDLEASLRPWLLRVTMNRARDVLRQRRRAPYVGIWLPGPLDEGSTSSLVEYAPDPSDSPETQYSHLESLSFGFLLAAEQLSANARAVLVLRDVFGLSVEETAEAVGISAANVKTTLHRARKAMASAGGAPRANRVDHQRVAAVLMRFLQAILARDVGAAERELGEGVRVLTDSAGEFLSARKPIHGAANVVAFYLGIAEKLDPRLLRTSVAQANGAPAIMSVLTAPVPRIAPLTIGAVVLGEDGRIATIVQQSATRKLSCFA